MSETLPRAIDGMSAADVESRVAAATEIHRIGRALADHAVFPWWSDKELSALLGGGNPFVTIGLGLSPDVLTSRDSEGNGAIARYLQKFGEGIQQIELRCRNVDRATAILRERFGLSPVYPATRPGADGARVNFFLVSAPKANKVLIELYEPAPHID